MAQASFFQAWEPAPQYEPQPSDTALEQRISKLAQFAARNGPTFVELMKQRQQNNPEYAFLHDGLGSGYFRWMLYCFIYGLPADQPTAASHAPHQMQNFGGGQPGHSDHSGLSPGPSSHANRYGTEGAQHREDTMLAAVQALPPDVDSGFTAVLAALTGTRESIRQSKEWFLACAPHTMGLAAKMALHQRQLPTYEQQLHVIFLANDILLKSAVPQQDGAAPAASAIARTFQAVMPEMLHAAFVKGNGVPEVQERLTTIMDFWGARQVFEEGTIAAFKRAMVSGPEAALPPAHQGVPEQGQAWSQEQFLGVQQQGQHPPLQPHQFPPAQQPGHFGGGPPAPHMGGHFPPAQQPGSFPPGPQSFPGGQPHAPFLPPDQHSLPRPQQAAPHQSRWSQPMPPQAPGNYLPPDHAGAWGAHSYPPPGSMAPQPGSQGWFPPPAPPPARAILGSAAMSLPPPDLAGFSQPPGPQPVDPMSFPPGLIPSLVENNLKTEEPYYPLSRADVDAAGLPDAQQADAYLSSRLDRFRAELLDYRPGSLRADFEDEQRRQRTRNALGGEPGGRKVLSGPDERSKMPSDGSFRGERGRGGPAGLGFNRLKNEDSGGVNDPFHSYRKQRSGHYHDSMSRAAASANEPQAVG